MTTSKKEIQAHIVGSPAKKVIEFGGARYFSGWGVAVLIAVFFLTLLPLVVAGSRYFGDEHYYTDGAMRMVQKGDYLTPYYATDDGLPHFNKPILTYWVVAASYKVFGISFLSSRLPFLIAGCLLIWLTYKTSLMLFHRADDALIAAVVILSNFHLFSSSVRSTPDILQCLFISVSLYGFMDILFNRNKTVLNYMFAYIGAALAVQTKGLLGFLPIIYAFLFCRLQLRRSVGLRDLLDARSMAAGVLIALFWFVAAYCKYGDAALKGFFEDQVGSRLNGGRFAFFANCWSYLRMTAAQFLPWSGLVPVALCLDAKIARRFFQEHKDTCGFAGGWFLVFLFVFSAANLTRGRYMLPTYPLLSAVVSSLLARVLQEGRTLRVIRKTFGPLLLIGAVYGIVLIVVGVSISARVLIGGGLALSVSVGLYAISRQNDYRYALIALGLSLFLILSVQDIFVRPVFDVSPAPAMTDRLLHLELQGKPVTGVGLERFTLSNIKVLSGGRIDGRNLPATSAPEELERHPILLLSQTVQDRWNAPGYNVEECGYTLADFKFSDIWEMIKHHDKDAVFAAKRIPCFLAIRELR